MFLLGSVGWAMAEDPENGGSSSTGITTLQALKDAINGNAEEITLGGNITNANTTESEEAAITINRALTLDGKGFTLSGSAAKAILKITGTGAVTIKNLTVENTNSGYPYTDILVEKEAGNDNAVTFNTVKLGGSGNAGINIVGASVVSIENVEEIKEHSTFGIQLSEEGEKAPTLTIGAGNKFPYCCYQIMSSGYPQYPAKITTTEGCGFSLLGGELWTDRYNPESKTYTIPIQGRTPSIIYTMELGMAMRYSNTIEIGPGILDLAELGSLEIDKSMTIEGAGSDPENGGTKIVGQFDIVSPDEEEDTPSSKNIVFKNLAIEGNTGTNGLLNVMTENVNLLLEGVTLHQKYQSTANTFDPGWSVTAKGIAICNPEYNSTDNPDNISITMKQSSILMDGMYNRGICYAGSDTEKPTGIKLTLIDSDITAAVNPQNAIYGRGISLYGLQAPELSLSNSKVQGFYYPVNLSMNEAAKVTIEDGCIIQGYAALNIHDPNGNYLIKNSSLVGRNYNPKGTNDFATIVLDSNAKNNTLAFEDASLSNLQENTALEYIFSIRDNGNSISLKGNTTLKSTTDVTPYLFDVYSNVTYNLSIEPTVSFKDKDDNDCILVYDSQNAFKNAVTSFDNLLTSGVLAANDIIKLPALTYELEEPLSFEAPFTIEGAGIDQTIFKAATKGVSAVSGQNLITLNGSGANGTTIKNLTIQDANNYGLHVYQTQDVTLDNVALKNNLAGGMYVNGSKVTATGIQTSGNVWGGIEVGKGTNVTTDPKLTISNSTLSEATQIWADTNSELESNVGTWVNGADYRLFEYKPDGKEYNQTFWTNRPQITIKVDKTTFIKEEGKTYQLTYTTTPANIKGITVKYCTKSGENYQEVSGNITEVGTYYVFFTRPADSKYEALNEMVVMTITNKSVPTISTPATLQESVLEAGLPLSMYHLVPGKAVVSETEVIGTYSWADGNQVLAEGENRLTYIFTPANLAQMDIVTGTITANANRYFTVKTGVSANGKATITNKSTSDRYVKDSQLTLTVTPDEGYTFTGWKDLGSNSLTYMVTEDKELIAEFTKKKYTVTFSQPVNGSLTVKNESGEVTSGATLDYGTVLTVALKAHSGYTADAITTTGSALVKGEIFLDANTTITATVTAIPSTPKTITITQPTGGSIRITNKATGKEIVSGTQVTDGTKIIIERTPNKGYKLASTEQAREEMTIDADKTITATFDQETYTVTASTSGTGCTLTVSKTSGLIYGEEVTYTSSLNAGYKGIAMMVNEKEVPANGSFIVTGNMTVKYIVEEKATLSIPNENQSYVYNGRAQAFVVKTTPAGLTNVNVTYKKNGIEVGTPTDAGEYDVYITRAEDENYKAFSETRKLTITKAPVIITTRPSAAPSAEDDKGGKASVAGTWSRGAKPENPVKPILRATIESSSGQYAIFTPSSENYAQGYCLPGSAMNIQVTINQPTDGSGTISVWDGNLQIANSESNNALSGSELTIYATPAVGHKLKSLKIGDEVQIAQADGSFTVTPTGNITVSAEFEAKATLNPTISGATNLVYDGTVKTITISDGVTTGWNYSVQQNGITVSPINAGTYDVLITREEDDTHKAYRQLHSGALVIRKATLSTPLDITAPSATVLKGALLSTAALSGGASTTDGTFVWEREFDISLN